MKMRGDVNGGGPDFFLLLAAEAEAATYLAAHTRCVYFRDTAGFVFFGLPGKPGAAPVRR